LGYIVVGNCWRCERENVILYPDPFDEEALFEQAVCTACLFYLLDLVEEVENA
jgi:hypothetical protein